MRPTAKEKYERYCDLIENFLNEGWSFYVALARAGCRDIGNRNKDFIKYPRYQELKERHRNKAVAKVYQMRPIPVDGPNICTDCGKVVHHDCKKCFKCRKRPCEKCGRDFSSIDLERVHCCVCTQAIKRYKMKRGI